MDRVLFHYDPKLKQVWLPSLLNEFDLRQATPRTVSFAEKTTVSFLALTDLVKILGVHKNTLKTVVVPTYYDVDLDSISGRDSELLQYPWTFCSTRSRRDIERINKHNRHSVSSA